MPAKTSLDEVKQALTLKSVKDQLGSYALGLLIYEQTVYQKTRPKELLSRPNDLDLGFYYTVQLLDRLAETDQVEAVTMIQAILSFDAMGRYLLGTQSIELDGEPFRLMDVLVKHEIDVTLLKETALHNRTHTAYLADETALLPASCNGQLPAVVAQDNIKLDAYAELTDCLRSRLEWQANKMRSRAFFHHQVTQLALDFDLLSQPPGREAVREFLLILSELFEHAKMQDSSNLDVMNSSNSNSQAMTSFLQETLSKWFVLSLVQASSTLVFNQRLQFLMAVFSALDNKMKACSLPVNISGDVYLPFFTFSAIIARSVLKDHPLVLKNNSILQRLNGCHIPASMKAFLDSIHVPIAGKLSSMRIELTSSLAMAREIAYLNELDGSFQNQVDMAAKLHIKIGGLVYQYFNPSHHKLFYPLRCMLASSRKLLQSQSEVALLSRKMDVNDLIGILHGTFAIHNTKADIHEQLDALENALFMQTPRLFYYTRRAALECCDGQDALLYIKDYVRGIKVEPTHYVAARCSDILARIAQKDHSQPHKFASPSIQNTAASPLVENSMFSREQLPDDWVPNLVIRKIPSH